MALLRCAALYLISISSFLLGCSVIFCSYWAPGDDRYNEKLAAVLCISSARCCYRHRYQLRLFANGNAAPLTACGRPGLHNVVCLRLRIRGTLPWSVCRSLPPVRLRPSARSGRGRLGAWTGPRTSEDPLPWLASPLGLRTRGSECPSLPQPLTHRYLRTCPWVFAQRQLQRHLCS